MRSLNAPCTASATRIALVPEPALTFSVQHFCLHDGPGIRSMVFLKGCPLRCVWCQNPESWRMEAELAFKRHLCNDCGRCVTACPSGAMKTAGHWDAALCDNCFKCVDACPTTALLRFGEEKSADALLAELRAEYSLLRSSGGGVTFSGGEASLFPEFVAAMARQLQQDGIHTAVETCGLFKLRRPGLAMPGGTLEDWREFAAQPLWQLFSHMDLVLFDLKLFDNKLHRQYCGGSNVPIIRNFRILTGLHQAGRGPEVWPRIPLIPGITDTRENLLALAGLVKACGLRHIILVPYHNLGESKRDWLHLPEGVAGKMLAADALQQSQTILTEAGMLCCMPGEEAGWGM